MYNILITNTERLFAETLAGCLITKDLAREVFVADKSDEVACFSKSHVIHLVLSGLTYKPDDITGWLPVIKKELGDVPVLALTSEDDIFVISRAMQYGIQGCLTKNCSFDELSCALEKIFHGELYFMDGMFYNMMKRVKKTQAGGEKLTKREHTIIKLISMENTTKEIAKKLFISENTVESHRKNIFSKLGVKNSAGLMKYALQNGIVDD